MNEQIAVGNLFKRRPKRRNQCLGQIADKAHGVVYDHFLVVRQTQPPRGWVERREHLFLDVNLTLSQGIEQRRFTRVSIADKRDYRQMFLHARLAAFLTLAAKIVNLLFELSDPIANAAAVGFELGFTRSASADSAS